jgi:hypothetical protein
LVRAFGGKVDRPRNRAGWIKEAPAARGKVDRVDLMAGREDPVDRVAGRVVVQTAVGQADLVAPVVLAVGRAAVLVDLILVDPAGQVGPVVRAAQTMRRRQQFNWRRSSFRPS